MGGGVGEEEGWVVVWVRKEGWMMVWVRKRGQITSNLNAFHRKVQCW